LKPTVTDTLHSEATVSQPCYALTVSCTLSSILAGSKPKGTAPKMRLCKLRSGRNSQKALKQRGLNTQAQNKHYLYCTYDTQTGTPPEFHVILFL